MTELRKYGILEEKGRKYENIVYVMALIYNSMESEIEKYLTQYDLSIPKFNILMIVEFQGKEEGMSQVDISKRLLVTPGNITKILDRLIAQGLINKVQSKTDRRNNVVKTTPKARKLIDNVWKGYDATVRSLTNKISTKEQETLSKILLKWLNALQEEK